MLAANKSSRRNQVERWLRRRINSQKIQSTYRSLEQQLQALMCIQNNGCSGGLGFGASVVSETKGSWRHDFDPFKFKTPSSVGCRFFLIPRGVRALPRPFAGYLTRSRRKIIKDTVLRMENQGIPSADACTIKV
jgi:hypothetical protein